MKLIRVEITGTGGASSGKIDYHPWFGEPKLRAGAVWVGCGSYCHDKWRIFIEQ